MESRENPLFGRKVFFISPSYVIDKYLIEKLRQNEYEAYILRDIKKVKGLLAKFPDSMCFINIDEGFSYSAWFNFMKSFQLSQELSGIYLGILSNSATWEDKDKFLMNIKLPGGFNQFDKTETFLNDFMKILDLNGAKGRRKFLRLDTRGLNDVSGYMNSEGKLYAVNIKDLSSAGFAITYRQELMSIFQKNTLIRDMSLSVGRKTMICSCIVFNTQVNPDGSAMSVLMLTNENPEETKIYIRNFIFEKYGRQMESLMEDVEKDTASYSQPDEYSKLIAVQDRNYDELIPVTEHEEAEAAGGAAPAGAAINTKYTGNLDEDIL